MRTVSEVIRMTAINLVLDESKKIKKEKVRKRLQRAACVSDKCGLRGGQEASMGSPQRNYSVPFCIFNLISPILTVLYGFTGFNILQLSPSDADARRPSAA